MQWCDYKSTCDMFCTIDINECAAGTDLCDQNCTNTVGSYRCSCGLGYRMNDNGYQCDGKHALHDMHIAKSTLYRATYREQYYFYVVYYRNQ